MEPNNEINDAVIPLKWLIGKWRSIEAKCFYPTIKTTPYNEEIIFESVGQPLLNYTAKSWIFNESKSIPMHLESGYLRIKRDTNRVAFLVAHNSGLTTLEEGNVEDKNLNLKSTGILRANDFTQGTKVGQLKRTYRIIDDNKLEYLMSMKTDNTELTEHLRVVYEKIK